MVGRGGRLTLFGDGTQGRATIPTVTISSLVSSLRWNGAATAPSGTGDLQPGGNRSVHTGAMVLLSSPRRSRIKPKIEWAPMQPGDVQHTAADLTKSSAMLSTVQRSTFSEGFAVSLNGSEEARWQG